ncbi:MAG TPA: PH domain-containing protein [Nitrososphaera sp.]|nr:PH domain-containing protein [Nitrososphaera sp.]
MNVPDDVIPLLAEDEKALFAIKQKKYRPSINTETVTITNKRLILRKPSMLRIKKTFIDYFYSDIANVVLDKGPLRSTLMLNLRFEGNDLVIEDIPNSDALEAFKYIREGIDKWRRETSSSPTP